MSEISILSAQSIFGCELGCRNWRGPLVGCEFYGEQEIADEVKKQFEAGSAEISCEDSYPERSVTRQEALDIAKQ